jgi:hypothetical protein
VHCSGLENPVNISALDSHLWKSQMMLTASRGHESATACETEEDRFIWTSGGSAEFDAVSFACGKKCRDEAACASSCLHFQAALQIR